MMAVFLALALAIKNTTAPQLLNFWIHKESYGLDDMVSHAWLHWHLGPGQCIESDLGCVGLDLKCIALL